MLCCLNYASLRVPVWQVHDWLMDLIGELLEPPPLSQFEVDRLGTIVKNKHFFLALAQGALASEVSAGKSAALQEHLRRDVEKAEREVEEANREVEEAERRLHEWLTRREASA